MGYTKLFDQRWVRTDLMKEIMSKVAEKGQVILSLNMPLTTREKTWLEKSAIKFEESSTFLGYQVFSWNDKKS